MKINKIIAGLLITTGVLFADELTIAFGQYRPPFILEKSKKGLEIDICRLALAYKGHTMKIHHMPNKRLQNVLKNRTELDGAASVRKDKEDGFYYVDKFIYYDNYAVSKKKSNFTINKVLDLVSYKVLAWQNAYRDLGDEFFNIFNPDSKIKHNKYQEHYNQTSQITMFWAGRADTIIIDKTIFGWHRIQLNKKYNTSDEIIYHNIFSGKTYFQVAFRDKKIASDFQEGLNNIKETGEYDKLYKKYIQ